MILIKETSGGYYIEMEHPVGNTIWCNDNQWRPEYIVTTNQLEIFKARQDAVQYISNNNLGSYYDES